MWFRNLKAAWLLNEIDDATYEKWQLRRVWALTLLLFVLTAVAAFRSLQGKGVTPLSALGVAAMLALALAGGVGRQVYLWMRYRVRDTILRRLRKTVEDRPDVSFVPHGQDTILPGEIYGTHRRSKRYGLGLMGINGILAGVVGALWTAYGPSFSVVMLGVATLATASYAIYVYLDRRPYLDISAEGIWCRRWGDERLGFDEFKAVYPRNSAINIGVTLVPKDPTGLRPKLSWLGRLALKSGDFGGTPAHVGTLTIWTNRTDLPTQTLIAIQKEVLRANRPISLS